MSVRETRRGGQPGTSSPRPYCKEGEPCGPRCFTCVYVDGRPALHTSDTVILGMHAYQELDVTMKYRFQVAVKQNLWRPSQRRNIKEHFPSGRPDIRPICPVFRGEHGRHGTCCMPVSVSLLPRPRECFEVQFFSHTLTGALHEAVPHQDRLEETREG
ncbi:hypothetical protein BC628DRAFT_788025 [Trametes gibbosa]|nr:hypothetical protein BC628DRAFT_788025 [Trametes gibbosa]